MYDLLSILGVAGPIVLSLAGMVYSFFASRSTAGEARIAAIEKKLGAIGLELVAAGHNAAALETVNLSLGDHEKRLFSVESELKHLPSANTVSELKLEITKLAGLFGRLEEQMAGVSRTTHRIDDYLREGAKQ